MHPPTWIFFVVDCVSHLIIYPPPCFVVDEIKVEVARPYVPAETRPGVILARHAGNVYQGTPARPRVAHAYRG